MTYYELKEQVQELRNQRYNPDFNNYTRTWCISRVVREIEKGEISEEQKIKLLEEIFNMFARGRISTRQGQPSIYTHLRQSLYNLILLKNNNATSMRKKATIASTRNLIRSGLIYESVAIIELPQIDGLIMGDNNLYKVETFEITTLGKRFMQDFYDKGMEVAKREQQRLNMILP